LFAAFLGGLVSLGLNKMVGSALVDVRLGDPLIYTGVPLLLLAVSVFACWLPARRVAVIDPMASLRAE
jgi:putative ABC transport system permease protein